MADTVVFVDERVAGHEDLARVVYAGAEIVLLQAGSDGVAQVRDYLDGRGGIGAIHLISHGSAGALHLGSATIDSDSLVRYADDFAAIGRSLTASGDLLFYACNLAAGEAGLALIGRIADLTGADVAASTDLTGAAALGGDWILETSTGAIEASEPGSSAALAGWSGVLAPVANTAPVFSFIGAEVTTDFGAADVGRALAVQSDGRIVVAGHTNGGKNTDFALVRYNANGTHDASFSSDGRVVADIGGSDDEAYGIALQTDGRIVVVGRAAGAGAPDFAVMRFNTNGTLDTTFNGDGKLVTDFIGGIDEAASVRIQSNGRIVVAGFSIVRDEDFALARYTTSGMLDTTFDGNGTLTTTFGGNERAYALAVQSDGKIVVAGYSDAAGEEDFAVARYNTNGTLDTTFSVDGLVTTDIGASDRAHAVAVQADGKIVVAGFSNNGNHDDFALVRFNANGTLDMAFDGDGKVVTDFSKQHDRVHSIALQTNGAIVVAGTSHTGVDEDFALARYSTSGALDTSFSGDGIFSHAIAAGAEQAYAVALQANGGIVAAGSSSGDFAALRLNPDGSLDAGFSDLAYAENAPAVVVDDDVRILDAELSASNYGGASLTLARAGGANADDVFSSGSSTLGALTQGAPLVYFGVTVGTVTTNSGGTLVLTFDANATQARVNGALQKIAYANTNDIPPGEVQLDWTFSDGNTGAQGSGGAAVDTATVRVAITAVNDAPRFIVLPGDGKVTTPISVFHDVGNAIALQPDGRVVVAGYARGAGNEDFAVVRYRNGAPDKTFSGDGKVTTPFFSGDDIGNAVALQPDGRIVVAGRSFTGFTQDFALARYHADGALDIEFGGGGTVTARLSLDDSARAVLVQPDGKIVLVGDGQDAFLLVRYGADGFIDTTFGSDGLVYTQVAGSTISIAYAAALQPDGKILAVGTRETGSINGSDFALVRYNSDGSLDTTFDADGMVTTPIGASIDRGYAVALQADGRIVVAGESWTGSSYDFALARYNADGSLDSTFDDDGIVTTALGTGEDGARALAIQADGRIVVAGRRHNGTNFDFALARYNADGTLDTTFDGDGTLFTPIGAADDRANAIALQADGRILVAGVSRGGNDDFALVRYNADGSLDTTFDEIDTFDEQPIYTEHGAPVVLAPNAQIFDAELAAQGHYGGASVTLARQGGASAQDVFSATGTLGPLTAGADLVYSSAVVGSVVTNSGGTLRITFNSSATQAITDGVLRSIAYANTGDAPPASLEIDWRFSDGNTGAQGTGGARSTIGTTEVFANAVNDRPMFGLDAGDGVTASDFGFSEHGADLALLPDGRIVVVGDSSNGPNTDFAVARYNADGMLDTSFSSDGMLTTAIGSTTDDIAESVSLQADGAIVVAGRTFISGVSDFAVVRYTSSGALDTSFSSDGKVTTPIGTGNDFGNASAIQADGKILVAGSAVVGNTDFAVVRYNANGTLDTGFDSDGRLTIAIGSGFDQARAIAVQGDGKILLAGTSSSGNDDFAVVRLNANGSLDTTFSGDGKLTTTIGSSNESAAAVVVQADGKILVAGYAIIGGTTDFALVRYNADGTLDTTFDGDGKVTTAIGSGNDRASSIALQDDGRIVLAGQSLTGDDDNIALARYNADGSLDTTFDGDGTLISALSSGGDVANGVVVQPDGRIVIGGSTSNGSDSDFVLVRYNADGSLDTTFAPVSSLNAAPVYTEGGAPVVLDSDVRIFDAELTAQGHYGGASLSLKQPFASQPEEVFSATGLLGPLVEGGDVVYDGVTVGTVHIHSNGWLFLIFNDAATQARIDGLLQSIAYSISGAAPPESVELEWRFNDGNDGLQGSGGSQTVTGTMVVTVEQINQAPVNTVPGSQALDEDTTLEFGGVSVADLDADFLEVTLQLAHGQIELATTNGLTFSAGSGIGGVMTFRGSEADINAALSTLVYRPGMDFAGSDALTIITNDLGLTGAPGMLDDTDAIAITVAAFNDAPAFTMGPSGPEVTTDFGTNENDLGFGVTVQADGRIVVTGYAVSGGTVELALARYDTDGSLDATFGGDGTVETSLGTTVAVGRALAQQGDGRLVVAGYRANFANTDFALARYNADGTLDTSFDADGWVLTDFGVTDIAEAIALQSDGKIVAAGAGGIPVMSVFAITRYNADGSLDTTFDTDGRATVAFGSADAGAAGMALQSDGRIVLAGYAIVGGRREFALARLNTDGTLDTSFSGDGTLTVAFGATSDEASAVAVQADGSILVAGESWTGSGHDFVLARYNADGTVDTSFGGGDGHVLVDFGADDRATSLALQSDGRIVVAGHSSTNGASDFAVARLRADGTLDTAFDGDGKALLDFDAGSDIAQSMALQADGRIVVAGQVTMDAAQDFGLTRFAPDGSLDPSFGVPNYVEDGPPVVLDDGAVLNDVELEHADNYAGGVVTLARSGGPNADDRFVASGLLGALTEGGALVYNGLAVGTVTTNSAGTLVLTFNGDATQTRVNNVLQSVAYSNDSDAPPTAVQIDWSFSDGNVGAQGSGGALHAAASSIVSILPVTDTYLWSTLTNDQLIGAFDPLVDILRFDDPAIPAALVTAQPGSAVFSHGGKSVTLGIDFKTLTTANVTFDDGSALLVGDASAGAADDDSGNTLTGGAGADRLIGLGGDDTLNGGGGNDTLDGGSGADMMSGNLGDDTYRVDTADDVVSELAGEGTDEVVSTITYTLGLDVENLTLAGAAAINGSGNAGNNNITGNAAPNVLNGAAGDDTLSGGLGNDFYHLDSIGDVVIEEPGAGTDRVYSSVTHTLAAEVEQLVLTGAEAIDGTGNAADNVFVGN
ncbi:MAG TPA: DUF4347 domain-containing protein, partial [Burkholderiales bacterium]|nr:DUF4347 domain-containing protein [Burkholderiales bacterium]